MKRSINQKMDVSTQQLAIYRKRLAQQRLKGQFTHNYCSNFDHETFEGSILALIHVLHACMHTYTYTCAYMHAHKFLRKYYKYHY